MSGRGVLAEGVGLCQVRQDTREAADFRASPWKPPVRIRWHTVKPGLSAKCSRSNGLAGSLGGTASLAGADHTA
jgi:hypothetical protein